MFSEKNKKQTQWFGSEIFYFRQATKLLSPERSSGIWANQERTDSKHCQEITTDHRTRIQDTGKQSTDCKAWC